MTILLKKTVDGKIHEIRGMDQVLAYMVATGMIDKKTAEKMKASYYGSAKQEDK